MKESAGRTWLGIALAALGVWAGGPASGHAAGTGVTDGPTVQAQVRAESPSEWGTSVNIDYVVPAWEMQTLDGSVQNRAGFNYNRYSPTGVEVEAPLHLPAGALINKIEVQGCDTSTTDQLVFVLFRVDVNGNNQVLSPVATTGVGDTPGCMYFNVLLPAPHQVDNYFYAYYVAVRGGSTGASYSAARVYYRLQVSPAPVVATFPSDVPTTHPFFRFVEALAAAGVTGGCGTGAFCPDTPVTRGQLAVFLSTALGLHFPD